MTESPPLGADAAPPSATASTPRVPTGQTPPATADGAPPPTRATPVPQRGGGAAAGREPTDLPGSEGPEDPAAVASPPLGLWERMRTDPEYAPEHLALEAVRRLGPEARDWAARVRAHNPRLTADEVAQLAIRRFVARARLSGAISGVAGLPGTVVDLGVLAWMQARMVLYVAAAYQHDPEHPDRATDLLVLQRVHKVAQTARLALGVAVGRERASVLLGQSGTPLRQAMLRLGLKLARMVGIRAVKRLVAKAVPGAAIVLGGWANSSATKALAARSVAYYRPGPGASPARPSTH